MPNSEVEYNIDRRYIHRGTVEVQLTYARPMVEEYERFNAERNGSLVVGATKVHA